MSTPPMYLPGVDKENFTLLYFTLHCFTLKIKKKPIVARGVIEKSFKSHLLN